ncbi:MAG: 2,3-bisphosphoglycerate-independent phosphoglycerate mutase [Bacillota bacterium]|nr:2,3-bisphosphoglycerate-independent phosphoglycerate mutase [Bacillota bacterium]
MVLCIMDGWGINPRREGNAVALAATPNLDRLYGRYPTSQLEASGEAVGVMEGQMGDSNIGHLNLGAGRIVYQDLVRISRAIRTRDFFANPVIRAAMRHARDKGTRLHLMGLVSPGGVHSHSSHLYALLKMARDLGVPRVFLHCFLDGRDVPPSSAREYLAELEARCREYGVGRIATISGRYYAMDRDKRWDRVEKAYRAMVHGEGLRARTADEAVTVAYGRGETDEFVVPTVLQDEDGGPVATIGPDDAAIFFNFRFDRARELTYAFVQEDFTGFPRADLPGLFFVCLTRYDETIQAPVAFPPQELTDTVGEYLGKLGKRQLRTAETEKYAHVTFFFNGGVEEPNPGEDRRLVPSPRVATYDLQPEMSAYPVADGVVAAVERGSYDLIVVNFANGDMVGHTGVLEAAVRACEAVDTCVGRVAEAVLAAGGAMLLTADHGNCEQMIDYETGEPWTAHTLNPVPVCLIDEERRGAKLRPGILADVAPTLLELLGLPVPAAMSGESLLTTRPGEK